MTDFLTTMKAVTVTADHWVTTSDVKTPSLEDGEVLVKVEKAGINPTDWKHAKFLSPEGVIAGCDFAGTVIEVSPHGLKKKDVKVGDRVAGVIHGSKYPDRGAFAQYLAVDAHLTFKIPDNVTFEQAATVGVPFFTAVQALYHRLGLPEPSAPATTAFPVLIWSGSTSVGQYAIQLARLSGLSVITTASPQHHDYLKTIGADVCYDYKDPEVSKKVREAAEDNLQFALDCISDDASYAGVVKSFGKEGGKVVTLTRKGNPEDRKDVQEVYTLLYSAMGKPFEMRGTKYEARPEDRAHHEKWLDLVTPLFASGKIKFLKTEDRGGLENAGQAYQDIIDGKNRATKYILTPQ